MLRIVYVVELIYSREIDKVSLAGKLVSYKRIKFVAYNRKM